MAAVDIALKTLKTSGLAKPELLERLPFLDPDLLPWAATGLPRAGQRAWSPTAEHLLDETLHHQDDGHDHWGEGFESTTSTSTTSASVDEGSTSNVETIRSVSASGDLAIDGLLIGRCWADGAITYCDPDEVTDYTSPYSKELVSVDGTVLISKLSSQQLDAARFALDADPYGSPTITAGFSVEGFTDLAISYAGSGTGTGTIAMVNHSPTPTASAYYPNDAASGSGGDAFFGGSGETPVAGNYDWKVMLHELGHALGLKHGQDTSVYGALPSHLDSMEYSAMTYRSYVGDNASGYSNEEWGYAQTYMMSDIAALQYMYGADFSANAGNTTYTWSPTSGATLINGVTTIIPGANRIFLTIWDGSGTDTYDLSAYESNLSIDLAPGGHSVFSSAQLADLDRYSTDPARMARGNVFNALLYDGDLASVIENAIGGSGHDTLKGNQAGNSLLGGIGNDILSGGLGNDILSGGVGADSLRGDEGMDSVLYGTAVTVALDGTLTGTGEAQGDTFSSVENVTGSAGNDRLRGSSGANVLTGESGADTLEGLAGNDTLIGVEGNDTLRGGSGADTLDGGLGFDDFVFSSTSESLPGNSRDMIIGFVTGEDDIVLTAIDANTKIKGNQAFVLDTNSSFSTGEIRQTWQSDGSLLLEFNTDRDSTPEMAILLLGMGSKLVSMDFEL